MKYHLSCHKECPVYPGEYVPLPEIESLMKELIIPGKDSIKQPLVNMDEFKDWYKIEVIVPGIKREDIFVHVQENVLTILILHKHSKELKKKLQVHEFNTNYMERHIILPKNADTEFVSAVYKQGILSLHIPKTQYPLISCPMQIVVY